MPDDASLLRLALQPSVVRRALGIAAVVGPILIAINHGDRLLAGELDGVRLFKMSLTFLVPYGVSTWSSVGALRAQARSESAYIHDSSESPKSGHGPDAIG